MGKKWLKCKDEQGNLLILDLPFEYWRDNLEWLPGGRGTDWKLKLEDGTYIYNTTEREDEILRFRNSGFTNIGFKDNPRWSWAMGANVKDIPKLMKKYPDRTYNPKTGQLLVKNRTEKKKLMREHGMEEY